MQSSEKVVWKRFTHAGVSLDGNEPHYHIYWTPYVDAYLLEKNMHKLNITCEQLKVRASLL